MAMNPKPLAPRGTKTSKPKAKAKKTSSQTKSGAVSYEQAKRELRRMMRSGM